MPAGKCTYMSFIITENNVGLITPPRGGLFSATCLLDKSLPILTWIFQEILNPVTNDSSNSHPTQLNHQPLSPKLLFQHKNTDTTSLWALLISSSKHTTASSYPKSTLAFSPKPCFSIYTLISHLPFLPLVYRYEKSGLVASFPGFLIGTMLFSSCLALYLLPTLYCITSITSSSLLYVSASTCDNTPGAVFPGFSNAFSHTKSHI